MRQASWRYLRLMAVVSLVILFLAGALFYRDASIGAAGDRGTTALPWRATGGLALSALIGAAWLFINSAQRDRIGGAQRLCALAAGLAALAASIVLAHRPDVVVRGAGMGDAGRARGLTSEMTVSLFDPHGAADGGASAELGGSIRYTTRRSGRATAALRFA